MEPNPEPGFLTYALAARLWRLGAQHPWLDKATEWCWHQIDELEDPRGYTVEFALQFLDAVPDPARAATAVERFRSAVRPDGTVAVQGGVEGEHLKPLLLSPRPGSPSRTLFSEELIATDLNRLESEQLDDGGWDFDFLHFSAGQTVEWRGVFTLGALRTLRAHGRM